jgi:hypothetical protein
MRWWRGPCNGFSQAMSERPAVALVALSSTALADPRGESGATDAAVMCGFAFASMLSVVLFLAGLPLLSMGLLALTGVSTIAIESAMTAQRRPLGPDGAPPGALELPESILAHEVRDTYRAILAAYADVVRAIREAPGLGESRVAVLQRCGAAVEQCGRMAVLSNPLQRYLDGHDRVQTQAERDRLQLRSETAADESTGEALGRAARARARQLETHDQIAGMRDRISARLELVRAALESFSATIVRLRVAGEEQMLVSGESILEHLDGVGDELEILETALTLNIAA